jgi:L-aspartate-alpha-decarboxylase
MTSTPAYLRANSRSISVSRSSGVPVRGISPTTSTVQVVNINNGARFETYAIAGTPGAGDVIANGAAARLVQRGDKIIIITYAQLTDSELPGHQPQVVHVDDENRVIDLVAPKNE